MKQGMYGVYDNKAKLYSAPFTSLNNATAIREFTNFANQEGHPWCLHPNDYHLYRLGTFDPMVGSFTEGQENLGSAAQYQEPHPQMGLEAVQ